MFKKAVIIPTGDELASGIVLDTDSPAIMGQLLAINGNAFVAGAPRLWTRKLQLQKQ